jgi:ATP-dependent RNA helicase DeaD
VDGELFAGSADGEAASDEASAAKPEDGAAPAGRRRRKRSRDRGRERSADGSQPTAAGDDDAQLLASGDERDISAEAPRSSERSQRSRQRAGADAKPLVAVDGALVPAEANGAEEHEPSEPTEPLEGLLYLNLGKRDGLRVPEVARLLRDSCELSRGQIGRIRVRDRYTFVDVPEGRLEGIITTLSGQLLHDKPLAPERAKTAKS